MDPSDPSAYGRIAQFACGYCQQKLERDELLSHMNTCAQALERRPVGVEAPIIDFMRKTPPDGTHLGKFPNGDFMLNCSECSGAMVCTVNDCTSTVHLHDECSDFRRAETAFRNLWWGWWNFKQRVMGLPRRLSVWARLWWYRNVVIVRIGWKHSRTHPRCFMDGPARLAFRYSMAPTGEDLRIIGYYCDKCSYIIEGDWREMQP